jgi:signal transduction histidine kinase
MVICSGLQLRESILGNPSFPISTSTSSTSPQISILRQQLLQDSECIESILTCIHHCKTLTDDILTLSRLDAGKLKIREEEFDPVTVMADACRMMWAVARGVGVEMGCKVALYNDSDVEVMEEREVEFKQNWTATGFIQDHGSTAVLEEREILGEMKHGDANDEQAEVVPDDRLKQWEKEDHRIDAAVPLPNDHGCRSNHPTPMPCDIDRVQDEQIQQKNAKRIPPDENPRTASIETGSERKKNSLDEIPRRLPALQFKGDEQRVRQILINLISNAITYTEEGGTVQVTLECDHSKPPYLTLPSESSNLHDLNHDQFPIRWIRYKISDTGVGMTPTEREDLFQRFSQPTQPATLLKRASKHFQSFTSPTATSPMSPSRQRHQGSGLGLFISKKMTEAMGGIMTVESMKGVGSTFGFTIPSADVVKEQETELEKENSDVSFQSRNSNTLDANSRATTLGRRSSTHSAYNDQLFSGGTASTSSALVSGLQKTSQSQVIPEADASRGNESLPSTKLVLVVEDNLIK